MWLSIMGMYEYDKSVFDGFDPPSYTDDNNVVHTLNRDDVINNILLQCAELEILYPSFETMKLAIGVWSASNQRTWNKLYKTMYLEYNPIWNVDADISQKRDINRDIDYSDNQGITGNNTHSVQGFNSPSWSEADKNDFSNNINDTAHTDDVTGETFTERRTGNIGIVSSQSMIKQEREISDFNIIEYITKSFKERFCLMIY